MTPEELFEKNRGLVHHISFRYKVPQEHYEDMIQEGYLTLWKAALMYDDSKGNFPAYAGRAIEITYNNFTAVAWNSSGLSASHDTLRKAYKSTHGFMDNLGEYEHLGKTALSTEYKVKRDRRDKTNAETIGELFAVEDEYSIFDEERTRVINEALECLTTYERDLLAMRYGLDGREPMTYKAIGEHYGYCQENARQVIGRILRKIREDGIGEQLSLFLEP